MFHMRCKSRDIPSDTLNNNPNSINPLRTKLYLSDLKTQFVPRSKHSASFIKTDKLILYREIIAVCTEIHVKHKCVVGRKQNF
jgi:hypothetical protein